MTAELALLRKEMLIHLRGRRAFLSLLLIVFLYSVILFVLWPTSGGILENVLSIRHTIFFLLSVFLLLSNTFVPNLFGTMFTLEKEWGTYDLLRGIPLSPWKIILGKLGVAVLYIHVVYATLLPFLVTWVQIGWLKIEQVGKFYLLFLGTMLLNTLFSLWISIRESHSVIAMRKASGYTLFCLFGMSFCGYFFLLLLNLFFPVSPTLLDGWWMLSAPFHSLKIIFFPPPAGVWDSWILNPCFFFSSSLVLFGAIVFHFRQDPEESPETKKTKKTKKSIQRGYVRPKWLERIEDPVLKKELFTLIPVGSWSRVGKEIGFFLFFLLWVFLIRIQGFEWLQPQELLSFQILILSFSSLSSTTLLLAKEVTSENFDLLRTTLISPAQFFLGKLKASFLLLGNTFVYCMVLNYVLMGTYLSGKTISFLYITLCNVELLLVSGVTLILALSAAALKKDNSSAMGMAYGLYLLFSTVVLLVAIVFYCHLNRWNGTYPQWLFAFSPVTGLYSFYETKSILWEGWFLHLIFLGFWGISGYGLGVWGLKQRWIDP